MRLLNTAVRNIAGAGASKMLSMAVTALSVPLLLQLLGTERYGTWVTMTSLISLVGMLDLGVGNSLRNSVALMISPDKAAAVRQEFIAFFHLLCAIAVAAVIVLLCLMTLFPLLERNRVASLVLYCPVLILLPLLMGSSILQGARAVGLQSFLQSAYGLLFFLFLVLCQWLSLKPDLTSLATAWSISYALPLAAIFAIAARFMGVPMGRLLRRHGGRWPLDRLKVGVSFLVLQIASLTLYSLGNAIIYNGLGAGEAARYDVLNKFFQVGLSFYSIVIGVMWSEIARFRALADFDALRSLYWKMGMTAAAFSAAMFLAAVLAPWFIEHWTRHKFSVEPREAFSAAALASVQGFAYVGAVFMNAFERVRAQVVLGIMSIILMIPMARHLISAGMGIAAVPLSALILTLVPMVFCNAIAIGLTRKPGVLVPT